MRVSSAETFALEGFRFPFCFLPIWFLDLDPPLLPFSLCWREGFLLFCPCGLLRLLEFPPDWFLFAIKICEVSACEEVGLEDTQGRIDFLLELEFPETEFLESEFRFWFDLLEEEFSWRLLGFRFGLLPLFFWNFPVFLKTCLLYTSDAADEL